MINPNSILPFVMPVLIALVVISIFSFVKEPYRQKINALGIAAAGAVYWSGGFGVWEFPFGPLMLFVAYRGLSNYKFIALGWLLHTCWDILHHLYGHPIIVFAPSSSQGCAICDSVLAIWFYMGATPVFKIFQKNKVIGVGQSA
jgi:hypothetical protein